MDARAEAIDHFEKMISVRKSALAEAAFGQDVLWINLCNVYRVPEQGRSELRTYIREHYRTDGRPRD
jgi:hypothetical protein